jgi:hypothetical protein
VEENKNLPKIQTFDGLVRGRLKKKELPVLTWTYRLEFMHCVKRKSKKHLACCCLLFSCCLLPAMLEHVPLRAAGEQSRSLQA